MLNFSRFELALGKTAYCKTESHYVIPKKTTGHAVTIPIYLTPRLAYFIGFFLGDGGLKDTGKTLERSGRREYKIIVGDYSEEFTLKIRDVFAELFGTTPPMRYERAYKGQHYYYLNPTCKAIHLFLTAVIGLGQGIHCKKVPQTILDAPTDTQQWFLRGYFDAEGSIHRKYKRKTWVISVHAKEHELLEQIQAMLGTCFGIRKSRLYREKNASKLFVTHQDEVSALVEKGLFTHPDKLFSPIAAVAQPDCSNFTVQQG